jgi:ligand-binding SRPBCC domain-containing protein
MKTITKSSIIKCNQEDLYQFHMDSNNISNITPKDTKVELIDDDGQTYEGKIVKIKTTKFFIPTYWEVEIQKLDPPNILIDVAQKSPFKYWKHQHIFKKIDENTSELEDIVEYELPFGILGKLVSPFVELDIKKMFEYRHNQTKLILENEAK